MPITLSRLTREYVFVPLTTDADLTGSVVEVAFLADAAAIPIEGDWLTATLTGDVSAGFKVRILVGPGGEVDLTPGDANPVDYQEWVRVTDNPERPVRRAGVVTIE